MAWIFRRLIDTPASGLSTGYPGCQLPGSDGSGQAFFPWRTRSRPAKPSWASIETAIAEAGLRWADARLELLDSESQRGGAIKTLVSMPSMLIHRPVVVTRNCGAVGR